ncbi:hypothetical protein D3C72_1449720 [compost metagenome]
MEFAVVVVFDDPLAALGRPTGQFQPPRQRQGRARGVLVRRRHIHAVGAAAVRAQQVRADALRIDINGHDPGLGGFKGFPGTEVAGVLQQDRLAGVHQQLRAQEQGLPRAAQHQDLVGRHLGAPLQVQIRRDRLAQRRGALRIAMQQHLVAMVLQRLALQALPDIGRKRPGLGQPCGKRLHRALIVDAAAVEDHPAPAAQARARLGQAALVVGNSDAPRRGPAQFGADGVGHVTA